MVAFGAILIWACGRSAGLDGSASSGPDENTAGTQFQGDGVQCGALVCSGTQQCCLVYVPADASTSNPTHACDQNCESVCADTCPDAGGQTSMIPPMGGMPGMTGMTSMPGNQGGMPEAGMRAPDMPGMPGMTGMPGMPGNQGGMPDAGMEPPAGPMGGPMNTGLAGDGGPAGGTAEDAGEQ